MRKIRKSVSIALPLIGILLIFWAALHVEDLQARLLYILAGVILIQAGVWKLTHPFLPSERRYLDLRREVEGFLVMVRQLNAAALRARDLDSPDAWGDVERLRKSMVESVDRMADVAGQESGETRNSLRQTSGDEDEARGA